MTDIADWYKQLPRFTKYWLSLTVGISLLAKIGILPDFYLVLFWDFVWRKLHVRFFFRFHFKFHQILTTKKLLRYGGQSQQCSITR